MSSNNFFEFVFMFFDTYKNLFGSIVIRSVGKILLLNPLASLFKYESVGKSKSERLTEKENAINILFNSNRKNSTEKK